MTLLIDRMSTQNLKDQIYNSKVMNNAELLNGRLAMLGVIAAMGAYALTGQLIPGVW